MMGEKKDNLLECCLFFTANSLARVITRMGEEEFGRLGVTPSYAFLLTLAIQQPGISQKELAEALHMAPSTVSRFVDSLIKRGLVEKTVEGRNTYIAPTVQGIALQPLIEECWHSLYRRYSKVLGQEQGDELTRLTAEASRRLHDE